ncbi:hypothetical protein [Oleiphilus messinensis]|nr:hypothetical protein [Oleiphilus messinensis]
MASPPDKEGRDNDRQIDHIAMADLPFIINIASIAHPEPSE